MLQNHLPFAITHDFDQDTWQDLNSSDHLSLVGGKSDPENSKKIETEKSSDILNLQLKNVRDKLELLKVSKESLELLEKNEEINSKIEKIKTQIEVEKGVESELKLHLERNSKLKNIFNSEITLPKLSETDKCSINWDHIFKTIPYSLM